MLYPVSCPPPVPWPVTGSSSSSPLKCQVFSTYLGGEFQGIEYYMCQAFSGLHEGEHLGGMCFCTLSPLALLRRLTPFSYQSFPGDWEHATFFTCASDLWDLLGSSPANQAANATSVVQQMQAGGREGGRGTTGRG